MSKQNFNGSQKEGKSYVICILFEHTCICNNSNILKKSFSVQAGEYILVKAGHIAGHFGHLFSRNKIMKIVAIEIILTTEQSFKTWGLSQ